MKKLYRNIIIASIIILVITLFSISVGKFINKFNELGKIDVQDTIKQINKSKLILKNVRTQKIDTIKLKNISIINFWASWCKPCIKEQPSLELLSSNYRKISFYQLSFDSIGKQQKIIEKNNWKLPAYLLEDTLTFNLPIILPTTYIMRDSIILKKIYGSTNWQDTSITNFIETL
jgi:thiol-disulfide isomerase/thioredoxin